MATVDFRYSVKELNLWAIKINGLTYNNLKDCYNKINFNIFSSLMINEPTTQLHGDMTFENIMCYKDPYDKYFLIDPNPNNIFNSQFVDYGKLRQSLGMGYEFLMQNHNNVIILDNTVSYINKKSLSYQHLLLLLDDFILKEFGNEGYKKLLLFEIMAYIRLIPYKIKKDPNSATVYIACLVILMNNFIEKHYNNEKE